MRSARAALVIATVAVVAASGCDLVFPPGKLAGDARTAGDDAAAPDAAPGPGVCDAVPFDPRRYSEAWQAVAMMPWSTASSLCTVRGWQLATINDVNEAQMVGSLFIGIDHWVGLIDRGDETWESIDGCPDPEAWDTGQPDFVTEDCAGLDRGTFRLHSFPCGGSASSPPSMICEQPRPPTAACAADAARPYNVADYTVLAPSADYASARTMCDGIGQHLVMIDTPDESLRVAALSGGTDYWVGATDAVVEGTWQTETGCPGFLDWGTSEPNNGGGSVENCASGIGGGTINDVDCTMAKLVICETFTGQ